MRGGSFFIGAADKIIGADLIKVAKRDQVIDLQLGSTVFDVAVSLLRFVDDFPNLFLRQVAILSKVSHSFPIIHVKLLTRLCKKFTILIN